MYIFGKIFGAFFGSMMAGPIGLILGLAIGHIFDKSLATNMRSAPDVSFAQKVFFSTTFEMMGYIAKADGRISEQEIQMARDVMAHLQLNQNQRLQAIEYFNLGKSRQFNWETTMDHFIKNCGHHPQLVQLFVEIQLQAAFVDGLAYKHKRYVLEQLCDKLHVPRIILTQMESRFYAEHAYQQQERPQQRQYRYQQAKPQSTQDELAMAYTLLGVTKQSSDQEVKKAYKKQMSQNHPDKLVAKGLPEAMIKVATEKTQSIQKAYELICQARGIK